MTFSSNFSNQYFYNHVSYSSSIFNGSALNNDLSPGWPPSSRLSTREDMLSHSSSVSNTPEIEDNQTFNHTEVCYKPPLVDPVVLSTSSIVAAKKENSLIMPLLDQDVFHTHQKFLTHSTDQFQAPCGSNHVFSSTPSDTSDDFANPIFPTLQDNSYLPEEPFTNFDASPPYNTNNNIHMMYVQQYQQTYCTTQNIQTPSHHCLERYPQGNIQYFTRSASIPKSSGIHTQQNAFVCSEPTCKKSFSRLYNLKSHMRIHTLERPFECPHKPCSWKFARLHDLKRHELQHTGQKPHHCRFCEKRFSRSDALKRHWKVDIRCAAARQEETRLNGGQEIKYPRKKRSKKE